MTVARKTEPTVAEAQRDAGDIKRDPKPCCRRLPGNRYCLLPDDHDGDCHGVTPQEIPISDFGPNRARKIGWGQ